MKWGDCWRCSRCLAPRLKLPDGTEQSQHYAFCPRSDEEGVVIIERREDR